MEDNYLDGGVEATTPQNNGLSSLDKEYLYQAAKWARFIGIVGFVFTALFVILALFMVSLGGRMASIMGTNPALASSAFAGFGVGMSIFYLLIALFSFMGSLYLYNFGKKTKLGIFNSDSETLTVGFENLKSYFKLTGIVMAVFIGLYALIFVFGLVFAGFAATR